MTDYANFINQIRAGGRTNDKVSLLQMMGFGLPDIEEILPTKFVTPALQRAFGKYNEPTSPVPMVTTPAGKKFPYLMTQQEWQSMTPAERVRYETTPEEWLKERDQWANIRVAQDRVKIIAEALGFDLSPQSVTTTPSKQDLQNAISMALWILPLPLEKPLIAGAKWVAGKILPQAAQVALANIEAVTVRLLQTSVKDIAETVGVAVKDKAFQLAFNTGLDKWIATQGRLIPESRSILGNLLVKDRASLIENATSNWLRRTSKQTIEDVVQQTINDIETRWLPQVTGVRGKVGEAPVTGRPLSEVMAGVEARLGAPAEIIKTLPTLAETNILTASQSQASKIGLDLEAVRGIAPNEYWVSLTTSTKG